LVPREMEVPVIAPVMPEPAITVSHLVRHHAATAKAPSAPDEPLMTVRSPLIRIDTVLDTHLPAIPAPVVATSEAEAALVCRKPQRLADSRLFGPTVCLHVSQWARLHAGGQDISPDGRSLISTDYEKQKTLLGSSCPAPMNVGASTGWHGGSTDCF
jgi:hypothetical protein